MKQEKKEAQAVNRAIGQGLELCNKLWAEILDGVDEAVAAKLWAYDAVQTRVLALRQDPHNVVMLFAVRDAIREAAELPPLPRLSQPDPAPADVPAVGEVG